MLNRTFASAAFAALLTAVFFGAAREAAAEQAKRYDGTINSIEGNKVHMTLRDGSTGDWTVAGDAPVTFGKESLKLGDVKPNWRAAVWVSQDGVIHTFKVVSRPGGKGTTKAPSKTPSKVIKAPMHASPVKRPAVVSHAAPMRAAVPATHAAAPKAPKTDWNTPHGKLRRWDGKVDEIMTNAGKGYIVVKKVTGTGKVKLKIDEKSKAFKAGKEMPVPEIHAEDAVFVTGAAGRAGEIEVR